MPADDRRQPPYTARIAGAWYWQPRGRLATVSKPQPLGAEQGAAFAEGWRLYWAARAGLDEPSAAPAIYSVSWGAARWRDSDDYAVKADGRDKARKTLKIQEDGLRAIEAEFGRDDLRAPRRRHMKAWYKRLKSTGKLSSAASTLRTARQLWGFFVDEDWAGGNPATKLKLHVPGRDYEAWTPARIGRFIRCAVRAGRPSMAIGVALIYDTAQNPADVIAWHKNRLAGGEVTLARGKTGQPSIVPLSWLTRALMRKHKNDSVFMVVSEETGQPYKYRNFAEWVATIRDRAGLPATLKAGNLRHEAAQEAHDAEAAPVAIQNLLAHKAIGTQKFYTRPGRADGAQAARRRGRKAKRPGQDSE